MFFSAISVKHLSRDSGTCVTYVITMLFHLYLTKPRETVVDFKFILLVTSTVTELLVLGQ